jgi:hypothetical protein
MRNIIMSAIIVVPVLSGCGYLLAATESVHREFADNAIEGTAVPVPPERPTKTSIGPVSSIATKARVDAATAMYEDAVNDYAALQNKAALLEAVDAKKQIKTKLTGINIAHSSQVQAAYDAKDVAEAKMNAAETIMNAAIADLSSK